MRGWAQWQEDEDEEDKAGNQFGQIGKDDGDDVEDTKVKGRTRVWMWHESMRNAQSWTNFGAHRRE